MIIGKAEKPRKTRGYLTKEYIQNVFDELEFSQALLEPLLFKVILIKVSIRRRDNRFSGIVVEYKDVIGFIPLEGLKNPYYNLESAKKAVENRIAIDVYFLKFQLRQNFLVFWQWQTPIFTMFEPF